MGPPLDSKGVPKTTKGLRIFGHRNACPENIYPYIITAESSWIIGNSIFHDDVICSQPMTTSK